MVPKLMLQPGLAIFSVHSNCTSLKMGSKSRDAYTHLYELPEIGTVNNVHTILLHVLESIQRQHVGVRNSPKGSMGTLDS